MQANRKIRVCDNCEKEAFEDAHNKMIGGSPFGGWIHIQITGGSTTLEALAEQKEFDFCSKSCLKAWLDE